jgi:hypothetical protein
MSADIFKPQLLYLQQNSPHYPLTLLLVLYLFVMEHVRTLENLSFAATKIPVYTAI